MNFSKKMTILRAHIIVEPKYKIIMSNVYGLALIAKYPEDSVKIESRAKELLKELTPEEHHEFGYNSFGPNEDGEAGIVFQTTLPVLEKVVKNVVEGIASSFPKMKLVAYETFEGPVVSKYENENGEFVEVEPLKDENGEYLYDEAENLLFP